MLLTPPGGASTFVDEFGVFGPRPGDAARRGEAGRLGEPPRACGDAIPGPGALIGGRLGEGPLRWYGDAPCARGDARLRGEFGRIIGWRGDGERWALGEFWRMRLRCGLRWEGGR